MTAQKERELLDIIERSKLPYKTNRSGMLARPSQSAKGKRV